MNIILTGEKGIGKTTVCSKLAELLKTRGIHVGGVICKDGMIHDLSGSSRKFYVSGKSKGTIAVGHYHIKRSALSFGSRALERACAEARVIFADEFGRLELNREGLYIGAVKALGTERALVVVRKSLLEPFKSLFPHYGFPTFEITHENRNALPREILAHLLPSCHHRK